MRWLAILFVLQGCALARYSETFDGQPVYVLMQPLCLFACISNLGTNREQVVGGTGGNDSISNSATLGLTGATGF